MKNLSIKELDVLLCSTGYLPPRTEDELLFFNEMYRDYKPNIADKHVDVESIINGSCRVVPSDSDNYSSDIHHWMIAEDENNSYSMAARNFDKLPQDILEKMKKQHKANKKNDK